MQGSKLYVGNLNYSVTDDMLKELFSEHGEVKEVNIIEGRGFGFVEMSSSAEAEKAKEFTDKPTKIIASGQGSDTLALHSRRDICTLDATVHAAKMAYKQANLTPSDIDLAEVHDCFTIAEIVATEDLGFCKKGEGGKLLDEKETEIGGRIPVNTSGGLKAVGHPVGATGIKQAIEIVLQLREKAGKRQVKDAKIGLTHNVGGSGATAVVHIFSR